MPENTTDKPRLTNRFDPVPDEPYGVCRDCGADLATQDDARDHIRKNTPNGTSHFIRVHNQTRMQRVQREVDRIIDTAIISATGELLRLVIHGDATAAEITGSMSLYDEFAQAWKEALADGDD